MAKWQMGAEQSEGGGAQEKVAKESEGK